jgi:hypothetical protein
MLCCNSVVSLCTSVTARVEFQDDDDGDDDDDDDCDDIG